MGSFPGAFSSSQCSLRASRLLSVTSRRNFCFSFPWLRPGVWVSFRQWRLMSLSLGVLSSFPICLSFALSRSLSPVLFRVPFVSLPCPTLWGRCRMSCCFALCVPYGFFSSVRLPFPRVLVLFSCLLSLLRVPCPRTLYLIYFVVSLSNLCLCLLRPLLFLLLRLLLWRLPPLLVPRLLFLLLRYTLTLSGPWPLLRLLRVTSLSLLSLMRPPGVLPPFLHRFTCVTFSLNLLRGILWARLLPRVL